MTDSARRMLRFLRESRAWSREDLSARTRTKRAPSTIENWEMGPTRLTFEMAEELLEALEVAPADFFKLIEAHQQAIGASPAYPLPEQARLPFSEIYEQSALRGPFPSSYAAFARIDAAARTIADGLQDLMQGVYLVEFERLRERAGPRPAPLPAPPQRPKHRRR